MNDWEDSGFRRRLEWLRQMQEQQHYFDAITKVSREINDIMKASLHIEDTTRVSREIVQAWSGTSVVNDAVRARLIDAASVSHIRESAQLLNAQTVIDPAFTFGPSPVEFPIAAIARRVVEALQASVRPFPQIAIPNLSPGQLKNLAAYNHLNAGVANAALLATVELDDEGPEEDRDSVEAERQLVEVMPAEALESLHRVGFVPFSLLSRVIARPQTLYEISPRTFEEFVAEMVTRLGMDDVVLTPERTDGGRDVIATKRVLGVPIIFAFECKRYAPNRPVSIEIARALLGTITHRDSRADRGILVTTSKFTAPARDFIVTSPELSSCDFDGIVEWLGEIAGLQRR